MIEKIKNTILYGGITREEYRSIRNERFSQNESIWRIAAVIGWFIGLYLMISSFCIKDLEENRLVYTMLMIATTIMGIMMLTVVKKYRESLNYIISAYLIIFLAFGIFLGVMRSTDQMTVTFHVLMISVPLLVILTPLHVFILEFVMLCFYCATCMLLKTDAVRSIDIYNGITFFAVAQLMYIITIRTKLNEILLKKKFEIYSLTDELTGLNNRNCYEKDLKELESVGPAKDLVYCSMDVNGLKKTNDTLGHEAGDEIICAAADCLDKIFSDYGKVYRTGGDEMAAIINVSEEELEKLKISFKKEVDLWQGSFVPSFSVSAGYSSVREFPDATMHQLARVSDERMYQAKAAYYETLGAGR